jgi:DNA-binding MarR family transcriptional regulator
MTRAVPDPGCACASARRVARLLTQIYDARLRRAGLEAPQFALLMALREHGPCSQADLGRHHALDKTTVSRNVRVLQRRGWIARARGSDTRQRVLALTASGRRQLAAALPAWKSAQQELRAGMTAKEWEAMFRAFRAVTRAAAGVGGATG